MVLFIGGSHGVTEIPRAATSLEEAWRCLKQLKLVDFIPSNHLEHFFFVEKITGKLLEVANWGQIIILLGEVEF